MELLALNPVHHRFTQKASFELVADDAKTVGIRRESRFLPGHQGGSEDREVVLPDDGIEPMQREGQCSAVFLLNAIPPHARSLLRGIPPLRPAARRRSAFLVPSITSLRTAAKNTAQTSSGLRPRKHSLALGSMGPLRLLVTRASFGNSKTETHHVSEQSNHRRLPRQRRHHP